MIDVTIKWSKKNKQFEVVRFYDGFGLYSSGTYKSQKASAKKLASLLEDNPNWHIENETHA